MTKFLLRFENGRYFDSFHDFWKYLCWQHDHILLQAEYPGVDFSVVTNWSIEGKREWAKRWVMMDNLQELMNLAYDV